MIREVKLLNEVTWMDQEDRPFTKQRTMLHSSQTRWLLLGKYGEVEWKINALNKKTITNNWCLKTWLLIKCSLISIYSTDLFYTDAADATLNKIGSINSQTPGNAEQVQKFGSFVLFGLAINNGKAYVRYVFVVTIDQMVMCWLMLPIVHVHVYILAGSWCWYEEVIV